MAHRDIASRSAKTPRNSLFRAGILTAALTLGVVVPLAGSAQAGPATAAACQPMPLTLIGASSTGLAVQQTGTPDDDGVSLDPVLTGAIGKRLTPRPDPKWLSAQERK